MAAEAPRGLRCDKLPSAQLCPVAASAALPPPEPISLCSSGVRMRRARARHHPVLGEMSGAASAPACCSPGVQRACWGSAQGWATPCSCP